MASQIVGPSASFQHESFVRGHHVYFAIWTPVTGEVLTVKRDLNNEHDVAVIKDVDVVGHVPRALSRVIFFFLGYMMGMLLFGQRQNRGIGLGLGSLSLQILWTPVSYR